MKKLCLVLPLVMLVSASAVAQDKHQCKVVWMDLETLRKTIKPPDDDQSKPSTDKKLPEGYTVLGTFKTEIGEEELTTRNFKVPQSNQYVTASVYYTDELMTVETPKGPILQDSILVSIAIGDKAYPHAADAPLRAVAEVNFTEAVNTFRISTRALINMRAYVAFMESIL